MFDKQNEERTSTHISLLYNNDGQTQRSPKYDGSFEKINSASSKWMMSIHG